MSVAASRPARPDGAVHLPETGMPVWLEGPPGGPWRTTVVRTSAEATVVEAPRQGAAVVSLAPGSTCVVAYLLREVPCEVPAAVMARDVAGYALRLTGPVVRLQRRDNVRVPVQLVTRATLPGGVPAEATLTAVTENLSAGGALLRAAEGLQSGTAVRLALSCGGSTGDIELTAVVLRSDRLAGSRPYRVAVTFSDLARPVEDRIVRFLFERQRELRRIERGRA